MNSELLSKSVNELPLNMRILNVLANEKILSIRQLVQQTEFDLLRLPNFHKKSLNELKDTLKENNLYLGMDLEYKSDNEPNNENTVNIYNNLKYEIISKAEVAFTKSSEIIKSLRKDKDELTFKEVDKVFIEHKKIVDTLERSIKDLFYR
jgi:hypothetical protein